MTPIMVTTWPNESTRTANTACDWVAETMVEGRAYVARSRHGAPNELAIPWARDYRQRDAGRSKKEKWNQSKSRYA